MENADGPRCRLQIAVSARRQARDVPPEDWRLLLHRLLDLARAMRAESLSSREALTAAGIDPPYLRVRAGSYLLVCDANPRASCLTVLHVLPNPG